MSGRKNTPYSVGVFLSLDYLPIFLANGILVELYDKPVDWEGNTGTYVDSINHADIELVAVVWLDIEVVAVLLEAIADAWVEDSNILLGGIRVPEWILSGEGG